MPNLSVPPSACTIWADVHTGSVRRYQVRARREFQNRDDCDLEPWSWISPACGTHWCITGDHLIAHSPINVEYPKGVCIYCGMPASGRDHLLPVGWTGKARRLFVATVPACADCNNRINDAPTPNITERRAIAHASLRRRKRTILSAPDWTEADLAELGRNLRSHVEAKQAEKRATLDRLEWPYDPAYDLRAFQKSGIEDPYAIGMLGETGEAA